MQKSGVAYVLHWEKEELPEFINRATTEAKLTHQLDNKSEIGEWSTLFISGGRKDKISKGDIVGLFLKQGNLKKEELGAIELKQDCAFVSVPAYKIKQLIDQLSNTRLKKKKVRIYEI